MQNTGRRRRFRPCTSAWRMVRAVWPWTLNPLPAWEGITGPSFDHARQPAGHHRKVRVPDDAAGTANSFHRSTAIFPNFQLRIAEHSIARIRVLPPLVILRTQPPGSVRAEVRELPWWPCGEVFSSPVCCGQRFPKLSGFAVLFPRQERAALSAWQKDPRSHAGK